MCTDTQNDLNFNDFPTLSRSLSRSLAGCIVRCFRSWNNFVNSSTKWNEKKTMSKWSQNSLLFLSHSAHEKVLDKSPTNEIQINNVNRIPNVMLRCIALNGIMYDFFCTLAIFWLFILWMVPWFASIFYFYFLFNVFHAFASYRVINCDSNQNEHPQIMSMRNKSHHIVVLSSLQLYPIRYEFVLLC